MRGDKEKSVEKKRVKMLRREEMIEEGRLEDIGMGYSSEGEMSHRKKRKIFLDRR